MNVPNINKPKLILIEIVEDDKIISNALYEEFRDAGFEVTRAFDGEEGLKLAKTQKPNLILLDIMMPQKNGFEVLKDLKKSAATKNIPVIVLTALGQGSDIEKITALGADGYIVKSGKTLLEVLEEVKNFFNKQE